MRSEWPSGECHSLSMGGVEFESLTTWCGLRKCCPLLIKPDIIKVLHIFWYFENAQKVTPYLPRNI